MKALFGCWRQYLIVGVSAFVRGNGHGRWRVGHRGGMGELFGVWLFRKKKRGKQTDIRKGKRLMVVIEPHRY